jgi:uncharacterized protein
MKKRIYAALFAILLCVFMCVTAYANDEYEYLLYYEADLLTDSEEADTLEKLISLTEKYAVDFAVAAVSNVGEYSVDEYTEYYFDTVGLGTGDDCNGGILLLIAMDDGEGGRAYRIHTRGIPKEAMTEDQQIEIGENTASYLSDEEYADAINVFLDESEYYINGEINGYPFAAGKNFIISLVIGVILALIITGAWKSQLKSVKQQRAAANYVKSGSMNVTMANDFYLYSTVKTEKIEEKSSSSSSSGSSGGRTTGGSF